MNSRLQALIDRGYSKEEVIRLSSFTEEDLNYASLAAFEYLTRECERVDNPNIIYIGGQPGCGKTVLSMQLKENLKNYVEIGIDNYRMYHPKYLEIEKCIRNHWKGKQETDDNSPGNDIADFTHLFAGAVTDRLAEMCSYADETGKYYNILMEWGMREPNGPLKTMNELKTKGYNNMVLFLATPSNLSYEACKLRANIMKNSKRIIRKVPKKFHDLCVETLPDSIDTIYEIGCFDKTIDYMAVISRDGRILWNNESKEKPGIVFKEYALGNSELFYNNRYKAIIGNSKEMIGLINSKKRLNEVKDIILFLDSKLVSLSGGKSKSV